MRRSVTPVPLVMALALMCHSAHATLTGTFDLVPVSLTGTQARFEVRMLLSGDPLPDFVDSIQLSIIGSDLDSGGTYSRYSYSPNLDVGNDGDADLDFEDLGFLVPGLHVTALDMFNPMADPYTASATPYTLGTLSLDLTGVSAGTPVTVTLGGGDPLMFTTTDLSGDVTLAGNTSPTTITSFAEIADDEAVIDFAQTATQTFDALGSDVGIPEPTTAGLFVIAAMAAWQRRRH